MTKGGQMKMHCKSPGQTAVLCILTRIQSIMSPCVLISLSIRPGIHLCLRPDRAVEKRGLTMTWGTWVTSTTAKWWIIQFRHSKGINILGTLKKNISRHLINHGVFCFPRWIDAPFYHSESVGLDFSSLSWNATCCTFLIVFLCPWFVLCVSDWCRKSVQTWFLSDFTGFHCVEFLHGHVMAP